MKRLGIPREVPCAVQQWEGLIAGAPTAAAGGLHPARGCICPIASMCQIFKRGGLQASGMLGLGSLFELQLQYRLHLQVAPTQVLLPLWSLQ